VYSSIISFLLKDLPSNIDTSRSVIAGGAVANLIYNKIHNKNAPVNDIDIFVFNQRGAEDVGINQDGALADYIGDIQDKLNNLKILDTKRDGIFNIINVEVDHLFDLETLSIQLMTNFDINATQACLIIDSKKIIALQHFDDFIKTKQLKAVSSNTPMKTMFRLLKKKKEFECYFDDNQIKVLFQFARFKRQRMTEETVDKFKPQIDELRDYFRVFKMSDGKYTVFLNRTKHNLKLHRSEKLIIKSPNNKILFSVFEEQYKNSKLYKKYLKVRPYRKTIKFILETQSLENYLKQDFNEKEIVHIEKVIRQVSVLSHLLGRQSLNDSIELCKKLLKIKEKDLFLYACGTLSINVVFKLEKYETFIEKCKQNYSKSMTPLAEPLNVSIKGVRELINSFELSQEGIKMSHCVSGYADKIKTGECRIFSIETEAGFSTIEIQQKIVNDNEKFWFGAQHRTKYNKIPNKLNRLLAVSLLNQLNNVSVEAEDNGADDLFAASF
jgi:hypothetical protein